MKDIRNIKSLPVVVLFVSLCLLVSCASKPHKQTGFLGDYSNMVQTKNFHRFYAEPGVDFKTYKNIVIKPVNIDYLQKLRWYDEQYNQMELKELTDFMKQKFAEELGKSYLINQSPEKAGKTLVLETALVKLAPVDVGSNVITSAVIAMPLSKGEVAIEGRLVDAASGKTVIRFTDTRAGKDSLVNVKDFTKFGHARVAVTEWAVELRGIMQLGEAERKGYFGGTFELKPW